MRIIRRLVVLVPLLTLSGYGQRDPDASQLARATLYTAIQDAQRTLAKQLQEDPAQYAKDIEAARTKIESLINRFLVNVETPGNADAVRADLKDLLGYDNASITLEDLYTAPYAETAELVGKKLLVVQYTLPGTAKGAPDTQTILGAYLAEGSTLRFISSLIPDFDGYAVTFRRMDSPVPGQLWYLAYGPRFGYNGTSVRVRMVAFDGRVWRIVWSPENLLNAEIEVNSNDIFVTHLDGHQYYDLRRAPFTRRETYRLTPKGITQISNQLGPD